MSDIAVEVVYALPQQQYLLKIKVPEGSTIKQSIEISGIMELRGDIDLSRNKIGIFSRQVKLDDSVCNGDRIEIYRPLIADPKILRHQRAERTAKNKGTD